MAALSINPFTLRRHSTPDTLVTIITAVGTAFPELLKVVNKILLPAGGVANDPVALMIWTFLILALVGAVWAFVQGMIRRGKKA